MKKLEIEKTKPTFIISTFKIDAIKVGLVFSISNFFIAKTSLANNWRSFSCSYLALADQPITNAAAATAVTAGTYTFTANEAAKFGSI